MTAVAVEIAEALTAQLAAWSAADVFAQRFTPVHSYADWEVPLDTADQSLPENELYVDVVLDTLQQAVALVSHEKVRFDVPVLVAVRKHFGPQAKDALGRVSVAEVNTVMLLVEQLHLQLTKQRLPDYLAGIWRSTTVPVAPHVGHLREAAQFTGIVRVTFGRYKDLP